MTRVPPWPWMLALVVIGALAWLRIFATWFAQDDFRWLLRATSEAPATLTTPRVLSMSLYFRTLHALADLRPAAYHAVNLALHLGTGLLLFRVLAGRLPAGAAAAAAACFLTSPALFDALHWISAVADLLCGACLMLAVWLLHEGGRGAVRGTLALAAYALALASKEIAVGAAPLLAVLHARAGGRAGAARAVACLVLAALFALPASGAWQTGEGGPYALKPMAALLNLPAFVTAATLGGAAYNHPSDLMWGRLPWVRGVGWAIAAVWLAALVRGRSRPAWLGCAWFLGLIGPVVMLETQFYLYYLYCALPGLVASVAFLVADRPHRGRTVAAWVAAALVLIQGVAIEARARSQLEVAPLPTDFVLRRARIARNAIADLSRDRQALQARVVMLGQQPVEAARQGRTTTVPTDYLRDPWWDENMRGALADGEALRLMLPWVREVAFQAWLEPADSSSAIAAYQIDGHLTVSDYATFVGSTDPGATASVSERLARAGGFIQRRLFREALRELRTARALAPDHADVLVNLGALEVYMGDSTAALATLERAVAVSPGDLEARFNLGLLQWRLGRHEEARVTWGRLLELAPDSDLGRNVRRLLERGALAARPSRPGPQVRAYLVAVQRVGLCDSGGGLRDLAAPCNASSRPPAGRSKSVRMSPRLVASPSVWRPRRPAAGPQGATVSAAACLMALGLAALCEAGTVVRGRIVPPPAPQVAEARGDAGAESTAPAPPDLRDAVIYVTRPAGVKGKKLKTRPVREEVKLHIDRFAPSVTAVVARSKIRFENDDRVYHKVFSVSPASRFDLGALKPGKSREVKFESPGVVQLFCELHPAAAGFVVVCPNRIYARPTAAGGFELPSLPRGAYLVHAWHPQLGSIRRSIDVTGRGDFRLDLRF